MMIIIHIYIYSYAS